MMSLLSMNLPPRTTLTRTHPGDLTCSDTDDRMWAYTDQSGVGETIGRYYVAGSETARQG